MPNQGDVITLGWQVLKELVCKRIREGREGPVAGMNAQQLRDLIDEQAREAERIVKRDKRSSYFRSVMGVGRGVREGPIAPYGATGVC